MDESPRATLDRLPRAHQPLPLTPRGKAHLHTQLDVAGQLREVYTAPTIAAAEARFAEFAEQWRSLYPAMIQMWESAWGEFVPFLK
ncbi:transposase, partial [Microbacterium sp. F2E]|uniref:transposase n=1 Tax=Microbacterium sp. F2E TaxID=2895284 RepID=UPI00227D8E7F